MHTTTSLLTALAGATLAVANPLAPARPLITGRPVGPIPGHRIGARQLATATIDIDDMTDDQLACMGDYFSIAAQAPAPPSEVGAWIATGLPAIPVDNPSSVNADLTTLCEPAHASVTPPASISEAWSSYDAEASAWMTEQASAVSSLQSACPGEISALAGLMIMSDEAACTSVIMGFVEVLEGTAATTTAEVPEVTNGPGNGNGDGNGETGNGNGGDGQGEGEGAGGDNANDDNTPTTTESTAGVPAARETGFVAAVAAVAVGVAGVVAAL